MQRVSHAILAAALVVGTTSAAHALSLTADTDQTTYMLGDTITVTITLDTTGAPAGQIVDVTLNWDPTVAAALNPTASFTLGTSTQIITAGTGVGNTNLTSLSGAVPWTGPPVTGCALIGPTAGNTCSILNQSNLVAPFPPDPSTLVGTLELEAVGLGPVGLNLSIAEAFGAVPDLSPSFQNAEVVPEPTTAALLGLGLLGLGVAGRRRQPH